jgi:formylglycine-generating enzyme required for sulfatase activity
MLSSARELDELIGRHPILGCAALRQSVASSLESAEAQGQDIPGFVRANLTAVARERPPSAITAWLAREQARPQVAIPPGPGWLGSDEGEASAAESPRRQVQFEGFVIDEHPITQTDYLAFLEATGYPASTLETHASLSGDAGLDDQDTQRLLAFLGDQLRRGFRPERARAQPDHPVVEVSWFDAVEYARWAGKRLPTAEEWERAAGGAGGQRWSWGSTFEPDRGNTREAGVQGTTPVRLYDRWRSPEGCCDMCGNVAEMTATPAPDSTWEAPLFIFKGGCWSFPAVEAQVWKRPSNPPDDLWNALGFRLCGPGFPLRPYTQEEFSRADAERTMEQALGIRSTDDPALMLLMRAARSVLEGTSTRDEFMGSFLGALEREPARAKTVMEQICAFIAARFDPLMTRQGQTAELTLLAALAVSCAESCGDAVSLAQARLASGRALLMAHDFHASTNELEEAVRLFRLSPEHGGELAVALLALAKAEKSWNRTLGEVNLDIDNAHKHLLEALPLLRNQGLARELQEGEVLMAGVHLLMGNGEQAQRIARLALSTSASLPAPDEIRGILLAGDTLLNTRAFDLADYCFRLALHRASELGDAEFVLAARAYRVLLQLGREQASAATELAAALEHAHLFDLDAARVLISMMANMGPNKLRGWLAGNLAMVLFDMAREEACSLPFHDVALGLAAISLQVEGLASERARRLSQRAGKTLREELLLHGIVALGGAGSDMLESRRRADSCLSVAERIGVPSLQAIAHLIRANVYSQQGAWEGARESLAFVRQWSLSTGNTRLLTEQLNYEAELLFQAGQCTAALEACDEATIAALEHLRGAEGAIAISSLHLQRARIFEALGVSQALLEVHMAQSTLFGATSRPLAVQALLLQSQYFMDPFVTELASLETAAKYLSWGHQALANSLIGEALYPLSGEVRFITGLFYLYKGALAQAEQWLKGSEALALAAGDRPGEIRARRAQAMLNAARGDLPAAVSKLASLVDLARPLNQPFLLLGVLTEAARWELQSEEQELAAAHLDEAIRLYRVVRGQIQNDPRLRKAWLRKNRGLFDGLALDVLLPTNRPTEALLTLQETKAASLQDMIDEAHIESDLLPESEALRRVEALRRNIRERELSLEKMAGFVGNEEEAYRTRVEIRSLRHELAQARMGVEPPPSFRLTPTDLQGLQELIARDGQLQVVEFFSSRRRLLAFVLTGVAEPVAIDLGPFEEGLLAQLSEADFLEASRDVSRSRELLPPSKEREEFEARFRERLGNLLSKLHSRLFEASPVSGRSLLEVLSASPSRHLVIIPSGRLARLPLHAAGLEGHGLLDRFESVSFAPGLPLLKQALEHRSRQRLRLFAVQDPDGSLRFARKEVEHIQKFLEQSVTLNWENANRANVLAKMADADMVHFACHGSFNDQSPLESGLQLNDGTLSLADIFARARLSSGCLVTLAACKSGLFDLSFADEFLGLPAGFLSAGASGVVSTLWHVDDLASMLLMMRFYEQYLAGRPGPVALCTAQRWLRDVTAGELAKLPDVRERFAATPRDAKPFSGPEYWAAFTYTGA